MEQGTNLTASSLEYQPGDVRIPLPHLTTACVGPTLVHLKHVSGLRYSRPGQAWPFYRQVADAYQLLQGSAQVTIWCMMQVWYFGSNVAHSVMGVDPDGCSYVSGESFPLLYSHSCPLGWQGCVKLHEKYQRVNHQFIDRLQRCAGRLWIPIRLIQGCTLRSCQV